MSEGILINKTSGTSFISYALARVIAPSGSNVTLQSSRGTAKTITSDKAKPLESNTNFSVYYFNVGTSEFGSCTITGVDGDYTMTKTVPITTNVEYTIDLFHRCPSGYQEVEYIEMPKKSFIYTDISLSGANGDWDIELEFCTLEVSSASRAIFGGSNTKSLLANSSNGLIWIDGWTSNNGTNGIATINNWVNWKLYRDTQTNNDRVLLNNSVMDANAYANLGWGTGCIIFNANYHQADGGYAYLNRRFRKCIITKRSTGEEVINMIPCYRISDNTAGFFNTANEKFYAGSGNATITAGPVV